MTPLASAARSPLKSSRSGSRVAGACLVTFAGILVAQYLAGYLLLWSFSLPPLSATPLTMGSI